jgi:hypothetical protein
MGAGTIGSTEKSNDLTRNRTCDLRLCSIGEKMNVKLESQQKNSTLHIELTAMATVQIGNNTKLHNFFEFLNLVARKKQETRGEMSSVCRTSR